MKFRLVIMCGTLPASGWHLAPASEAGGHEIVIEPCRVLLSRYPVNRIAVRPERYGTGANRNSLRQPASEHHRRRTEAGSKAAQAEAGGKRSAIAAHLSGIPRDINGISRDAPRRWHAIGCAGFSDGKACEA
jgi:hypothetical protein